MSNFLTTIYISPPHSQAFTSTRASVTLSLWISAGSIACPWCTTCAPQNAPLPAAPTLRVTPTRTMTTAFPPTAFKEFCWDNLAHPAHVSYSVISTNIELYSQLAWKPLNWSQIFLPRDWASGIPLHCGKDKTSADSFSHKGLALQRQNQKTLVVQNSCFINCYINWVALVINLFSSCTFVIYRGRSLGTLMSFAWQ